MNEVKNKVTLILLLACINIMPVMADPFQKGRQSVALIVGSGSSFDEDYIVLGAGYGYYVLAGLELGIDAKLSHKLTEKTQLNANFGMAYDTIDDQAVIGSSLVNGGPSFITRGLDYDPLSWSTGVGFTSEIRDGMELKGSYSYEQRDEYDNQSVSLKLRWKF